MILCLKDDAMSRQENYKTTNIDSNGNTHLFTTQETTTSTPNIRVNRYFSKFFDGNWPVGGCQHHHDSSRYNGGYSAQLTIDTGLTSLRIGLVVSPFQGLPTSLAY